MDKPSDLNFDKAAYHWRPDVDYRAHPELYRVGKGGQGVLICEPYQSELVPHWRFKTPEVARASGRAIYRIFLAYLRRDDFLQRDDFVGTDMPLTGSEQRSADDRAAEAARPPRGWRGLLHRLRGAS